MKYYNFFFFFYQVMLLEDFEKAVLDIVSDLTDTFLSLALF